VSGKLTCLCAICACSCQIVFKQHERKKSSLAQALETAGLPSVQAQSTVGFFHGIIDSHLKNGFVSALQESGISDEQASNDAASFAPLGILADPNIQSNTLLRKNLQAACGPRPRITKDGVSINVLRRSGATGADVPTPPTATSHWAMPPPRPMNAAVASRDSRFFQLLMRTDSKSRHFFVKPEINKPGPVRTEPNVLIHPYSLRAPT
jgi:hypothetical protein